MIDFFYSDPHFGHENICEYAGRPWTNVLEHDHDLYQRYCDAVRPEHTVLWCGDAFFLPFEESRSLLAAMPGRKILILGNHDRSAGRMAEMGFDLVLTEATLHMAGRTVRVSHYPYERDHSPAARFVEKRPKRVKGEALIHGHVHSKKKRVGNEIHVGVDAWDYGPAPYAEVEKLVREAFGA